MKGPNVDLAWLDRVNEEIRGRLLFGETVRLTLREIREERRYHAVTARCSWHRPAGLPDCVIGVLGLGPEHERQDTSNGATLEWRFIAQ